MVYRPWTIKSVLSVVCAALLILGACSKNSLLSIATYKPVITFAGTVGPDSLYLPGSRQYPNTCAFDADTVRMYFYSQDYSQGATNTGDQMRIDILSPDSSFITKRHARLHFTRYDYNQNTSTYEVTPADSLNTYNDLSMKVVRLDWQRGGLVNLIDLTASARPLGSYGTGYLSITRGVITGNIQ
jgi:hypothetical protein